MGDENDNLPDGTAPKAVPARSIEDRLATVVLPKEDVAGAYVRATSTAVGEGIIESIPLGNIITKAKAGMERAASEVREKKKDALLEELFVRSDESAESLEALTRFLSDPWGRLLFDQVQAILDDRPPEPAEVRRLAQVLRKIVDTDFRSLFDTHRYALSVIGALTPQALAILSAHGRWRPFISTGVFFPMDGKGTWARDFAGSFGTEMGVSDPAAIASIQQTVEQLMAGGLMRGSSSRADRLMEGQRITPVLTDAGLLIVPYIT
ncbi:hypothetical protein [Brevundimonas sp.]